MSQKSPPFEFFWYFATDYMLIKPKGSPFYIFRHYATFSESKNSKISSFFRKKKCFWALDIAPALDVPVLLTCIVLHLNIFPIRIYGTILLATLAKFSKSLVSFWFEPASYCHGDNRKERCSFWLREINENELAIAKKRRLMKTLLWRHQNRSMYRPFFFESWWVFPSRMNCASATWRPHHSKALSKLL